MPDRSNIPPGPDEDDELSKRFKALFNKNPASKVSPDAGSSSWKTKDLHDYVVDDDEVLPSPGF